MYLLDLVFEYKKNPIGQRIFGTDEYKVNKTYDKM